MMRSKAVALVACAVGILTAVTATADEPGDPVPPGEGTTQITAIEPEAAQAMSVLDEPRTTGDALPTDVAEHFDDEADFGMNPDLSRLAVGNISNSLYVVPADDHVCVSLTIGEGATMGCRRTANVIDGRSGPGTATVQGGGIAVYGLVPDGVESVTVATGQSDETTLETESNAYYTVLAAGTVLRTLSYTGPDGEVDFPIYDPAAP